MSKNYISSGNPQADHRYAIADDLLKRGDAAAAVDLLRQTCDLVPAWPPLHFRIGEILSTAGKKDEAIQAYESYLSLEPQDILGAAVKIALLRKTTPDKIPDAYVETLFNDYAPRFDHALVKKLEYRTPEMLASMLNIPMGKERILDLGCGTGLSGEAVCERGGLIDGVDISAGMLAQAEKKGIYFSLTQAEIVSFLKTVNQPYDIIIAADVFVYVGALDELFRLAARALNPGGQFAFSVQSCDSGFSLGADHRYAHSSHYICKIIADAGMKIIKEKSAVLRKDGGADINGRLYIATR